MTFLLSAAFEDASQPRSLNQHLSQSSFYIIAYRSLLLCLSLSLVLLLCSLPERKCFPRLIDDDLCFPLGFLHPGVHLTITSK